MYQIVCQQHTQLLLVYCVQFLSRVGLHTVKCWSTCICSLKGEHVLCCTTLADQATDSNSPVQLVHGHPQTGCVYLPLVLKWDHIPPSLAQLAFVYRDRDYRGTRNIERCCISIFSMPSLRTIFLWMSTL